MSDVIVYEVASPYWERPTYLPGHKQALATARGACAVFDGPFFITVSKVKVGHLPLRELVCLLANGSDWVREREEIVTFESVVGGNGRRFARKRE